METVPGGAELKRGAPDHWKMAELARLLKVPARYGIAWANGVMERLWHYTAKYHPQGDIGAAPNWAIANACAWPSKDADALVDALVSSRWLEVSSRHRLLVHDWYQHADESTKKWLIRNHLQFFCPSMSVLEELKIPPALALAPAPAFTTAPAACELPLTQAAVAENFPIADAEITKKIAEAAAQVKPDISDAELAEAVSSSRFPGQKTAKGYLKTVPAWLKNNRPKARDPDAEAVKVRESEARALDLYARGDPETKAVLRETWPDLQFPGGEETHAR